MQSRIDTRSIFVDVVSSDTLPPEAVSRRPCAYIANTAPAQNPGEHWVCFYFNKLPPHEYFDSYGGEPPKHFKHFLERNDFKRNTRLIQHPSTTVCGQYCLYFILMRSKGIPFESFVNNFSKTDLLNNDATVNRAVEAYYKIKKNIFQTFIAY